MKASFDVMFCPMTNVEIEVADPRNLTEDEVALLIDTAALKMRSMPEEYIIPDNAETICLYSVDGKEVEDSGKVVW